MCSGDLEDALVPDNPVENPDNPEDNPEEIPDDFDTSDFDTRMSLLMSSS